MNAPDSNKSNNKKGSIVVTGLIFIYIFFFTFISIWKYNHFGYNAIDLAIFNQVFHNTSFGDLFSMTIHPHSYLGDHFEIIILLLTPIYMLFRSPIILLILQTMVIGISAWPLYLIAKKIANYKIALSIVIVYLLNPFIHNINLFEFHILPFAIFTLFFSFYYYLKNNFFLFSVFSFASLLIREDVALIIIMFSILSIIDKKSKKWVFAPAIAGISWLIAVLFVVPLFNNYDSYKFIFYYSWLGDSVGEIVKNFFLQPGLVLSHIFSLTNIFLYLALFLPFLLLPFLKPKYLLLSALAFLQLVLGSFSGELILKTHYSSLLLVSVFVTTIYALRYLFFGEASENIGQKWQIKVKKFVSGEPILFIAIFCAVTIYGMTTFGPVIPAIKAIYSGDQYPVFNQLKKNYIKLVPDESSVTASYDLLPHLSNRAELYSLHYAFLGKKQYSKEEYVLPETDYMLIDTKDFLTYQIQYPDNSFYENAYLNGDNNIRNVIDTQKLKVQSVSDDLVLLSKSSPENIELYNVHQKQPIAIQKYENPESSYLAPHIKFYGWDILNNNLPNESINKLDVKSVPVALYWECDQDISEDYQLLMRVRDKEKTVYEKYYALGYGLMPSSEWRAGNTIQTNYWFVVPSDILSSETKNISLTLVKLSDQHSYLGVDGMLTATMKNVKYEPVGTEINIPLPE